MNPEHRVVLFQPGRLWVEDGDLQALQTLAQNPPVDVRRATSYSRHGERASATACRNHDFGWHRNDTVRLLSQHDGHWLRRDRIQVDGNGCGLPNVHGCVRNRHRRDTDEHGGNRVSHRCSQRRRGHGCVPNDLI